jgi:glycoside/pentoside/hexuronide:cation symporter, GPH family
VSTAERVPLAVKAAYGAPAFALAAIGIPIYVHLQKFYTDVVGVDVALLGLLILASRIFDAVTDPILGWISDRTRTRFGRRRPYVLGAAPPLALAIVLLFTPPAALDGSAAAAWFGATIFLVFLFWTAVVVPYESLGPEITFDHDERTTVMGVRDGLLLVGTLVAAVAPAILQAALGLGESADDERRKFFAMSVVYGGLVVLLCAVCVAVVRERAAGERPPAPSPLTSFRDALANRPFRVLLAAYTVSALGGGLPATLIFYYVEYVLGARADLFLALYFVVGIVCLPGWIVLARRFEKKQAWLAAMAINTGAFLGVFFLGEGQTVAYGVLVAISGIGYGATLAIPSAMQADVIDYDELRTGDRREGQYVGLWSISRKIAAGLGAGAALAILGVVGYQPNVEQPPAVIWTLRVLYAGVPCLCSIAGFAIALAYPIDRRTHEAIRAGIEARREGRPVIDPLATGVAVSGA